MKADFLLLDDDEITLLIHKRIIVVHGLSNKVFTFRSCEDFCRYISSATFSEAGTIVMLDINMPIMTGWECIAAIDQISIPQKKEIFLVTSSIDPMDLEMAIGNPSVKGTLTKPVNVNDLIRQSAILSYHSSSGLI